MHDGRKPFSNEIPLQIDVRLQTARLAHKRVYNAFTEISAGLDESEQRKLISLRRESSFDAIIHVLSEIYMHYLFRIDIVSLTS